MRLYVGRLQRLFVGAELVVIGYRDPKDDKFQLGVNGRADVILSGDTELLWCSKHFATSRPSGRRSSRTLRRSEPMAPEPRANPLLLGHEAAETTLLDAMRSGRMHHAWLITGPDGVGKATLAYRFARRLLAGHAGGRHLALDPAHPVFRRVAAGAHADLLTRSSARTTKSASGMRTQIAVEDVREISGFMSLTPAEGGWRVVDRRRRRGNEPVLGQRAAEDPGGAAAARHPAAGVRCARPAAADDPQPLPAPAPRPAAPEAMERLLATYLPELARDERGRLVTVAEGSPGRALLLARGRGAGDRRAGRRGAGRAARPEAGSAPMRWPTRWRAARRRSPTSWTCCAPAIAAAVRDVVRGRADEEQSRLVALRPLDAWGDVWHALTRLQDETERFNLDKRQAIVAGLGMLSGTICHEPDAITSRRRSIT